MSLLAASVTAVWAPGCSAVSVAFFVFYWLSLCGSLLLAAAATTTPASAACAASSAGTNGIYCEDGVRKWCGVSCACCGRHPSQGEVSTSLTEASMSVTGGSMPRMALSL